METPFLFSSCGTHGPRIVQFLPTSPPLVPILAADDEITPEIDRILTTVARDASDGDTMARNALYVAFAQKIARFVRRYRAQLTGFGWGAAIDLDDVAQEAFLVFADLVAEWPGGDSFCAYFLGHFPWELRNAVRRLGTANRPTLDLVGVPQVQVLADGSAAAAEAVALLETVAAVLQAPDGDILLWRIRDGETFAVIARRLGTSPRTILRAWDRIIADLRRSLIV
jgi:DNA-directed RNA polymerase specialized sigma24 family protein